jgi:23S rRNA (adenine2503-C2)-methyltransferase
LLAVPDTPFDPRNVSPKDGLHTGAAVGLSLPQYRRLLSKVVGEGLCTLEELRQENCFSKETLSQLSLPRLTLEELSESKQDGFKKLLFRTQDGLGVESVVIPLHKPGKVTLCLSSQVGCVMGCVFCATTRLTQRRNLEMWEIVDQFIQARTIARRYGADVSGVVFMGMGEPFLNYKNVISSAELFSYPIKNSISGKAITISTVGLVPEIVKYTADRHPFRLSISLGAATDKKRAKLVPIAAKTPIKDVMSAAREYALSRKDRINLAYVCISNQNVSIEDAKALGEIISDTPVRLDLIDVRDSSGKYLPPSATELSIFRDALREYVKQPVARRYSGGGDIEAGCGMLAAKPQNNSLKTFPTA